jgi:hypothetical protein
MADGAAEAAMAARAARAGLSGKRALLVITGTNAILTSLQMSVMVVPGLGNLLSAACGRPLVDDAVSMWEKSLPGRRFSLPVAQVLAHGQIKLKNCGAGIVFGNSLKARDSILSAKN